MSLKYTLPQLAKIIADNITDEEAVTLARPVVEECDSAPAMDVLKKEMLKHLSTPELTMFLLLFPDKVMVLMTSVAALKFIRAQEEKSKTITLTA